MNYRKQEVIGLSLCVLGLFFFLSLISHNPFEDPYGLFPNQKTTNYMGLFGVFISHYLMKFAFGWGSLFIPLIMEIIGYFLFTDKNLNSALRVSIYLIGLGIWSSVMFALIDTEVERAFWTSGYLGGGIFHVLITIFKFPGTIIIMVTTLLLLISGIIQISIYDSYLKMKEYFIENYILWKEKREKSKIIIKSEDDEIEVNETDSRRVDDVLDSNKIDTLESENNLDKISNDNAIDTDLKNDILDELNADQSSNDRDVVSDSENNIPNELDNIEDEINIEDEAKIEEGDLDSEKERQVRYRQYKLPVLDYLYRSTEIKNILSDEELKEKASHLVHALETFGVSGRVVRISPGPVITLFEIEPGEGVRVNKFTNLSDDLARVMKAQRVRIIAPIPGSKSVGIELPNNNPSIVYLRNIINSEQFISADSKLSVGLGKTTTGDAYVFDLSKMPHLLVAGATGAGKSVCINTMIISIIYKAKPDEVKFILIDPKKLELATYKSLESYHLITAPNLDEYVMTTPENAVAILDSAIVEMERRFQVFADARVRNITEYHERCKQNIDLENIPYIVVVIDELADLMLTSGRAIEEPITRLAQKARAVGIHLIVATQRPSVDVITGVIKSNFPARIAFQVSSKVDSRTIIDQMGAEKLLGRGDMLFLLPGTASPVRLHNAYVTLDEIESIMNHIENQPKPKSLLLPETRKEKLENEFNLDNDQDELLRDAAILVVQNQQASVSLLQRKFRIGYSRAGRIVDELEALGIISGYSGSKAREVLVDASYLDTIFHD